MPDATNIDEFSRALLEQAKRFLERAKESEEESAIQANLNAALLLACCSFEAYVSALVEDFVERPELSIHEKAFLTERKMEFRNGRFAQSSVLQMTKLEERLELLWTKFSAKPPFQKKDEPAWPAMQEALKLRNGLSHPKAQISLTVDNVEKALGAIVAIVDIAYLRIYGKNLPGKNLSLNSNLSF